MGKAARLKAERRAKEAEFGVFCPGVLEVLSIGRGDLKITLDTGNAEDVERAKLLIEEMLRKGYGIYVDTDDGPTRVHSFNPKRMTYTVIETPSNELAAAPERKALGPGEPKAPAKRARKAGKREIPVAGSKATAVGRTAGG